MKWIAVSGSWRKTNQKVKQDIQKTVKEIIKYGSGIISGGALGVDFIATDIYLKLNPSASKIKIFLPTTVNLYLKHLRRRAKEKVVGLNQVEMLTSQLNSLKKVNPKAIIENKINKICNQTTYYQRVDKIIETADELIAFQVNNSAGTQHTIDKAKDKKIPIKVFTYQIDR